MKFRDQGALCQHLAVVLQVRRSQDMQFSVTAVNAALLNESPVQLNEQYDTYNNSCGDQDISNALDEGHAFVTTARMPIDTNIPDLSEVISNTDVEERSIPIYELKRKTAPPISLLKERRAEELAWVKLFPGGRNGLREQRPIYITPLDYYQTRVMSGDKRFQFNEYLFYALSVVELCKAQQNVSLCARLRQDGAEPTDVIQNVHLVMRNIRGTSAYWHKAYTDLLAMVKNLGPPHWYLTLSCNDLNWHDMLNALLVADCRPNFNIQNLTFQDKQYLVERYPVTLSRHFMLRLNALFNRLRRENDPILGKKVVDFWWRVESQLRGSPHVHMVLWCADMPPFDSPEGIQLLEHVVTCKIPGSENINSEVHDLVTHLQTHRHTQTCYKNNRKICRFGFPRPISERTEVLDDDQAVKNGGRFYILNRTESETMINCYNPQLLKLWRANIDLQPCGSAIGVAYYISKYISKAKPAEVSRSIRQAIQNVRDRGHSNSGRLVFAIQNAILTHREISANECAFRLCHLKLRDSSRQCVFVNTCVPEQRYRMLRFDTENSEPYKNVFDRYVHRPHSLEHLSLGEFAIWYDVVSFRIDIDEDQQDIDAYDTHNEDELSAQHIILLDNGGRMRRRTRSAILRTRYFTLASDPEAYYYSLIVTHVPFRAEEELLDGFDSARKSFWAKRDRLRPLQLGFDAETMMQVETEIQAAISRIVAEKLAAGVSGQQNDDTNFNTVYQPIDCVLHDVGQITIEEFEERNEVGMPDNQFETAVACLNLSQRQLFKKICHKLLDETNTHQLLIFVTGGAGTGKTFTLKVMTEQIRRLSPKDTGKSVAVTAPTGVAARLIGGSTLHSTFALPIEKGRAETSRSLTGERLQRERQKWRSINWLIIDEISMVPYLTLRNIHLRLQQLKQNQSSFGGINIILFGDLMQLPPVSKITGGAYCFRQPSNLTGETNLWPLFSFCELPQNMRQAGDNAFVDILNNIRVGQLTMDQLEILDSRRVPVVGPFADGEAVRIFPTSRQVDAYNSTMTEELGKSLELYQLNAVDISLEAKTYGQRPRKEFIPDDPNKTGGILSTLCVGIGSRVMLRRNINVNHGLVNGAMGVIRRIEWPALCREQLETGELPQAVFIEFDDTTIKGNQPGVGVRIEPCTVDFDALRGQGQIERRMLPLILCWAVTVHKLQGTTLDRTVVDLGSHVFAKGQTYVALSRVKTWDGLAFTTLDSKKLLSRPHDENSLKELQRLRELNTTN